MGEILRYVGIVAIALAIFACGDKKTVTALSNPQPDIFTQADEFLAGPDVYNNLLRSDQVLPHSVSVTPELIGDGRFRTIRVTLTPIDPCPGNWDASYWATDPTNKWEPDAWGDQKTMSTKDGLVFTKDMADTAVRYMIRVYCRLNVIDPTRPDLLKGYPYAVRLKTIIADLPKLKQ